MAVEIECVRATMEESATNDAKKSWHCLAESECLLSLHLLHSGLHVGQECIEATVPYVCYLKPLLYTLPMRM